jgi:hypothetical protein
MFQLISEHERFINLTVTVFRIMRHILTRKYEALSLELYKVDRNSTYFIAQLPLMREASKRMDKLKDQLMLLKVEEGKAPELLGEVFSK